jgi:hypothetical protein
MERIQEGRLGIAFHRIQHLAGKAVDEMAGAALQHGRAHAIDRLFRP